ncbi:MAG: DEAD/DEAH box helicase family protein [Thaumarchaeota archaeon]|nr:DEAD/DEAH box helicase family protein [Nitrososphaerota archaeon]
MLEHFPTQFTPRLIQKEIINEVEEKINSGYKKIIISAPTGVGKSFVGTAIAQFFEKSFVVTASKHLQNQYIDDIPFLSSVKGKKNYACLKLMESKAVEDIAFAFEQELTCEKGQCVEEKTVTGTKYCKFKPKISDLEKGKELEQSCHYYLEKYTSLLSDHPLWNYHSFFQIMKFNKSNFAKYLQRKVSIFDEAHRIEDQIIQFIGIDITKKQLDECGINFSSRIFNDIDSTLSVLDSMRTFYGTELGRMETDGMGDYKQYGKFLSNFDRTVNARIDIDNDRDNFVINDPEIKFGKFNSISIKPLDISNFIQSFFETEYQIFMSATIDMHSFCENMGLSESDVAFIDTPKSPFPLENRKVTFLNIGNLGKNAKPEIELKVHKKIDELLTLHANERGLILTSSIFRCNKILENLSSENKSRIRICHSTNPSGKTQDDIIKEHQDDSTGVLLSSSLWEGVDLKDDLSRFQIIAKIPYPNYGEKRTKIKMSKYPLWYNSQTLMKLLQGFGRSIRSENDWAKTYVLDSTINFLISRTKNMIPKAYYDVLGLS